MAILVTAAQLLDWRPDKISDLADRLAKRRRSLQYLQDEIDAATPPSSWASSAGDTARVHHRRLAHRLYDMAAEVSDVVVTLDEAGFAIAGAQSELEDQISRARGLGFEVNPESGEVSDPATYEDTPDGVAKRESAEVEVRQIAKKVGDARTKATQADANLAAALRAAAKGQVEGGTTGLEDAIVQLPPSLDGLSDKEIAEKLGDDISVATVRAYINAEAEVRLIGKMEAGAEGRYIVNADGSVNLKLHLEAGLGKSLDLGKWEVDLTGGGTFELGMEFDSVPEVEAFLAGLKDAARDYDLTDGADIPSIIADKVGDHITDQGFSEVRTGGYVQASGEADVGPWLRGNLAGRVDVSHEWINHTTEMKFEASGGYKAGDPDDPTAAASASLSGSIVVDKHGDPQSFTLAGQMSGSAAAKELGIPVEGMQGGGGDVQMTIKPGDPYFDEIMDTAKSGDLDTAGSMAMKYGEVTYRETAHTEIVPKQEHEFDTWVAKGKFEYAVEGEMATKVYVKPAGQRDAIELSTEAAH